MMLFEDPKVASGDMHVSGWAFQPAPTDTYKQPKRVPRLFPRNQARFHMNACHPISEVEDATLASNVEEATPVEVEVRPAGLAVFEERGVSDLI